MYLTVKQQLKHLSKEEYLSLRELSHTAKNLYNQAVYNIRQYYFQENKYLNYQKNNSLLKRIIKVSQLKFHLFYLIKRLKRLELFLNLMLGSLKFSTLMK